VSSGRARVGSYRARDGQLRDVELAYDVIGEGSRAVVLVMGIGAQRIFWDEALCAMLVARGFRVVRFDHRDIGESTKLDAAVPDLRGGLARRLAGFSIDAPYTLSDMASDVVGLCDALGIRRAHVVGTSLGGMVGQHLAFEHADRVASLTAIMTTTGARRFIPAPRALGALLAPAPRTAAQAGVHIETLFRTIGSTAWPIDGARLRALGEQAFARGMNPRGFARQFAAVLASGDRTARLARVRAPALIVHGSRDPMFPLAAGRALAAAIPGATLLPIAGMGHDLPAPLWPTLAAAIDRHAAHADARGI
jgi:pimeloyl-ACP methyl ester carboxylesterase